MKRIVFALAAVATLTGTPAYAGLVDEVAQEKNETAQMVGTLRSERPFLGQYQVYGSRLAEGQVSEARPSDGPVQIVPYPYADEPRQSENGR